MNGQWLLWGALILVIGYFTDKLNDPITEGQMAIIVIVMGVLWKGQANDKHQRLPGSTDRK